MSQINYPTTGAKVVNGGRITSDGVYQAKSSAGVQSVKLQHGLGTGADGLDVTLLDIDKVEGSLRDDTVTLLTVADTQHGAVSLGRGYDTLVLGDDNGLEHTLKLDSVEMVKAAKYLEGEVKLNINGVAMFATDGSVSLGTASANDKSRQTITYTQLVDDTTLSLGGGQDKVIFKAGTLFRVDNGQLVATDGNGSVTFEGYASNATNLQIQVGNVTQTYKQWYKTADITPPVPSNFTATETTVGATSNERGTLGLYVADGTLLKGTARVRMVAKTPATVAVAAQGEVTSATLKVRDAAGNFALTSQNVVLGTTGNNTALDGTANADFMFGFDGNDSMTGGGGADKLYGGNGDDTFVGFVGADSISGGAGIDTLTLTATSADLNARADAAITDLEVVSAADAAAGVHINLSNQTDGFTIVGSGYDDTLVASAGVDTINSGAGNGDVLTFGAQGSLVNAVDTVTEYTLQTLDFAGNAALVGVGGMAAEHISVKTSANGKVTFHENDDTLAEKIAVIQADDRLDAANAVAIFSDGDDAYVYYAGTATGNADDQIVRLAGRSILDKIVVDLDENSKNFGNITLDREPPSDPLVTASSLLPTTGSWEALGGAGAIPTGFDPGNDGNSSTSQGDGVDGPTSNLIRKSDGSFGTRQLSTSPIDDSYSPVAVDTTLWSAGLNMFDKDYTQLYMGTNGYITFGSSFRGYSPQGIAGFTLAPMIAAQYDDLYINTDRNVNDSTGAGTSKGTHGMYYYADNNKMVFTWDNVSLYSTASSSSSGNIGSAFQIILHKLDGEKNAASKNFGIEIRYEEVTQQSSGATAGWTAGDKLNYGLVNPPVNNTNTVTVLSTVAEQQSNVGTAGVWAWEVRDGAVVAPYYVPDIGISTAVKVASLNFRNNSDIESFTIAGDGGGYGFTVTEVSETDGNTKAMLSTITNPHWNLWKNAYMDGKANITVTSVGGSNSGASVKLSVDIVENGIADPVTRTGAHLGSDTLTVAATSSHLNTALDAELSGVATVTAATAVAGVTINLSKQSEGFDIIGSAHNDQLIGSSGNDTITGGAGGDTLVGGVGNDSITGGAGADNINAGDGNDRVVFNTGDVVADESIDGGNDSIDVIVVETSTDFTALGDIGIATSAHFERIEIFDGKTATFIGTQLSSQSVRVQLPGDTGAATLDINVASGTTANFSGLSFGAGTFTVNLNGASGNESITGSAVNDVITGGAGADNLTGGNGSDTFVFGATNDLNGIDTITNFTAGAGAGADVLDFFGVRSVFDGIDVTGTDDNFGLVNLTADVSIHGSLVFALIEGNDGYVGAGDVVAAGDEDGAVAELVVNDGTDAIVIVGIDANDNTLQLARVYDSNATVGFITAVIEDLGTVTLVGATTLDSLLSANIA